MSTNVAKSRTRSRGKDVAGPSGSIKRRCVSSACIACRKRKSKCDGKTPSCAACSSVYGTECVYDPNSDHRRKGVYKKDIDTLKTHNSTLQTIIQALLSYEEEDVPALVHQIRTCESLEDVAQSIIDKQNGLNEESQWDDSVAEETSSPANFETELSHKMGGLRLENGLVRFIGGTSNLLFVPPGSKLDEEKEQGDGDETADSSEALQISPYQDPILSWTTVTTDAKLVAHLINMYLTWHYQYFCTLSKDVFLRDFVQGRPSNYCSALLVNAMCALGCHFTSVPGARADPDDLNTVGDHFFKEAKRLMLENDEHQKPRLATVQALALMSVREAGCGREASGWFYSGMSFRMACELGLCIGYGELIAAEEGRLDEEELDARRITFWGCFLFDKCWSNYLGRQPQLPLSNASIPKFDVFPDEDSSPWIPYNDSGIMNANPQPCRTRAVALRISGLCEISNDLLAYFYHPSLIEKSIGKQTELKRLSELHTRLESWRRSLPKEMEPKEGQLPSVLLMHMFFHLLFIHLYRPFLKYTHATSPLPTHVSPRRLCTQAAAAISKLLRLYKRTYSLRQICNFAVYILNTASTIHLLNLPDKNAKRDIIHGVKHLEEMSDFWPCARRALKILDILATNWKIELPPDASATMQRVETKFGPFRTGLSQSPEPRGSPAAQEATSSADSKSIFQTFPTPVIAQQSPPSFEQWKQHEQHHNVRPSACCSGACSSAREVQKPVSCKMCCALTQEQQSRWSAHQPVQGAEVDVSTSVLFGGADAFIAAESQNWWMKDQSALAFGLDNWTMIDNEVSLTESASTPEGSAAAATGAAATSGLPDGLDMGMEEFEDLLTAGSTSYNYTFPSNSFYS